MLDPIIERVQALAPEFKAAISVVIVLVGILFVAKPIINCIGSFRDAKWLQAFMWGGAAVCVIAFAGAAIVILFGLGKEVGTGLEKELGLVIMQVIDC
ncbi:TPA: hypothetical protein PB369_002526 [Staphylococcus aureus]|nr:hypothetical protein [Staphylococcus aureus]